MVLGKSLQIPASGQKIPESFRVRKNRQVPLAYGLENQEVNKLSKN